MPINSHTTLTLDEDDIRLCHYPYSKSTTILDTAELAKFASINFFTNEKAINYYIKEIKIVIDIHCEGYLITILLDNKFNYKIDNKTFICNAELKNWLLQNNVFSKQTDK